MSEERSAIETDAEKAKQRGPISEAMMDAAFALSRAWMTQIPKGTPAVVAGKAVEITAIAIILKNADKEHVLAAALTAEVFGNVIYGINQWFDHKDAIEGLAEALKGNGKKAGGIADVGDDK